MRGDRPDRRPLCAAAERLGRDRRRRRRRPRRSARCSTTSPAAISRPIEAGPRSFQPMNVNFGLFPPLASVPTDIAALELGLIGDQLDGGGGLLAGEARGEAARQFIRWGVSSMAVGSSASGSMPICCSSASRRGDAEARTRLGGRASWGPVTPGDPLTSWRSLETIGDAALGEVVGRHLDQDLVAGEHADAVLAHLAGGVGDDLVLVLELHPKRRVGQQLLVTTPGNSSCSSLAMWFLLAGAAGAARPLIAKRPQSAGVDRKSRGRSRDAANPRRTQSRTTDL